MACRGTRSRFCSIKKCLLWTRVGIDDGLSLGGRGKGYDIGFARTPLNNDVLSHGVSCLQQSNHLDLNGAFVAPRKLRLPPKKSSVCRWPVSVVVAPCSRPDGQLHDEGLGVRCREWQTEKSLRHLSKGPSDWGRYLAWVAPPSTIRVEPTT